MNHELTTTLITGANGFIASHLCRLLVERGYAVRALVRPTSDRRSLEGVAVDFRVGDMLQPATLAAAVEGCDCVFHVAGAFTYGGVAPEKLIGEAETGMRNIITAARASGVRRVVLTSSSVTMGAATRPTVLDERHTQAAATATPYVRAKIAQLETAYGLAKADGPELLSVHPTLVIGGPDHGPTESNYSLLSYLSDPYKMSWIGGCNMVAVEDVALGHLLVAERGQAGERYLLGSENWTWEQVHTAISELCGVPRPVLKANHTVAYLAAALQEGLSLLSGQRPLATREQAKMVGNYYWYDHGKAAALGYHPRPLREALIGALSWLTASEHLPSAVRATLRLSPEIYQYRRLSIGEA